MNPDQNVNLPEGQSTKEDIAKIMEQMNRMSEQIKLLTSFGFGPPRGGQEDDKLSERALASSEGEEQREELEELNSQHGIGAPSGLPPAGRGWRIRPPLEEGGRRLVTRSGGENPDLIDGRSIISRAGRKRSENLKPETMKVFKFDGTDYEIWSKAMGFYLDGAGLWEVVTGVDPLPQDPEEQEEWRLVNTKACNVLFSALTRDQQKNVVNCDLAEEMWRTLGEIYARKSMINQAHLIQEYEDYHMRRGTTMQKYISEIRSLLGKLRGVGVVYPEKSIVLKVLRGLSEEFAVDRKILFKQQNLTFEGVCGELLSEAMMSNNLKGRSGQGSSSNPYPALANVGQGSERKKKASRCYICKKEDHMSWDCPHKSATPGEKVWMCYICNEKGHKSPDCPSNKVGKKPKPGGSNLAVGKEDKTTN
jgi:hypothetical protein